MNPQTTGGRRCLQRSRPVPDTSAQLHAYGFARVPECLPFYWSSGAGEVLPAAASQRAVGAGGHQPLHLAADLCGARVCGRPQPDQGVRSTRLAALQRDDESLAARTNTLQEASQLAEPNLHVGQDFAKGSWLVHGSACR